MVERYAAPPAQGTLCLIMMQGTLEYAMRIIVSLCFMAALLFSTLVHAKVYRYGKPLTPGEATAVSAILDSPEQYIGKPVKIQGMVIEVCAKRGCWIYVAGDRPGEKIQVKVTDGEIVFPMEAAGRIAVVEGVVEELNISREELIKYLQHLAEEKGQPFDPATVKDERMIRLRGLGAEIEG